MIGITISGEAYAAIACLLQGRSTLAPEKIVANGEYCVWLPQAAVARLLALRDPGETFSHVILRLAEGGSLTTLMR
jgi:hypothetical protein